MAFENSVQFDKYASIESSEYIEVEFADGMTGEIANRCLLNGRDLAVTLNFEVCTDTGNALLHGIDGKPLVEPIPWKAAG